MFFDTYPAGATPEFRVTSAKEIATLLKSLIDGGSTLHLSSPNGGHYSTTLWSLDTDHKRLSLGAEPQDPQLQCLLDAGEATAVTYLDSVKLQFDLGGLVLVHGTRTSALQGALPSELFRFQRRHSYRVRPLAATSPMASMRHPSIPDMVLDLRVLDVSAGGCALFLPDDVPPLNPGVRLHRVRLQLDSWTRLEATLTLCHVTAINPGARGVRIGCELAELTPEAQRVLQRYIDQTQKRRRLMAGD